MPKRTLVQTYIHKGVLYGPGEVELPDDVATDLESVGAFGKPKHQDPRPTAEKKSG